MVYGAPDGSVFHDLYDGQKFKFVDKASVKCHMTFLPCHKAKMAKR